MRLREWLGCAWVNLAENLATGSTTPSPSADWLYAKEVADTGRDVARSVELFHRVNEQDFEACERCQPAMASRAYAHGGVLVLSEHHIGGFHD